MMKRMVGALSRAVGSKAPANSGALDRVLSAARGRKNPQPVKGNHMVRNAGPVKETGPVSSADQSISDTGDKLRRLVGRVASRGRVAAAKGGKIRKYAEGGKVGTAMSALRALAKKYQEAIDSGDTVLARRLKKQLDAAGVTTEDTRVGEEKAKTFAKGGKVQAASKQVSRLLATLKRLDLDPHEFDLYDEKGNFRVEEAKEVIEDAIHGEREVDDFTEELGTEDPAELTKKIKSKVRGK